MRIPVINMDQHQVQQSFSESQQTTVSTRSGTRAQSGASSSIDNLSVDSSSSFTLQTPDIALSASHSSLSASADQRRHSKRSVKRRKFDDELVESSLNKHDRPRTFSRSQSDATEPLKVHTTELSLGQSAPSSMMTRSTRSATAAASASAASVASTSSIAPVEKVSPKPPTEKKKASTKSSSKSKIKKQKGTPTPLVGTAKDLGRWKPQDDLLLIEAVQQTSDLKSVHLGVKFTCNFTLREIEERWYTLLYDQKISKLAMSAIQQLPPDVVAAAQAKCLFSKAEEDILVTVSVSKQPSLQTFEELLSANIATFHNGRTAKSLQLHWLLMKQYHLLPEQSVQPLPKGDHVLNFSDAEELIDDSTLGDKTDEHIQRELLFNDKRQKKEIRHLEQEMVKWQVLVESVTGVSPPDFDNQTLAVLRGRLVRYLMRSKEISLGRTAKGNQVDVDLALEGPAWKISRRQGVIKLRNSGDFVITNDGKRPIFVDGKPILPASRQKLVNNSVIEISCLRFIFLINQDLIKTYKMEGHKSSTSS